MQAEKPRWKYRFENYKRAFSLLREAIEIKQEQELSQLEKEGIIQRFEYTWELAWKLIKDYLEHEGFSLVNITPASVIRSAAAAKIIENAEIWMFALDDRNKMSHTYDFAEFEIVINNIEKSHLAIFDDLYIKLYEIYLQK